MADYRVYQLNRSGHIHSVELIVAESDAAAEAATRSRTITEDREVWCGARKIAFVPGTTSADDRSLLPASDQLLWLLGQ